MSGRRGRGPSDRGGGGRGAYFKARYGGGGRGGSSNASQNGGGSAMNGCGPESTPSGSPGDWNALQSTLRSIDNQHWTNLIPGAYKRLLGEFVHTAPMFRLKVDFVQGDPYAAPSRVRVLINAATCKIPSGFFESKIRRTALADFLTRVTANFIRSKSLDEDLTGGSGWSGPKGGAFNVNAPGQEVLERTSCMINSKTSDIEVRFTVRLPARGRTILGQAAANILVDAVPKLVNDCLFYGSLDQKKLETHVRCTEQQEVLRNQLSNRGLTAFIGNGSILPRKSGFQSLPMTGPEVVAFESPEAYQVKLKGVDGEDILGMGVRKGVTVLTGGGFHGKSTLLEAVQNGIYDNVPGDGRETVVTDSTAFKIRAEDGRSVKSLDISPFITGLPGKVTGHFDSEDASGSTSMASNIQEALELGSKLLLIDEDSSATNLLVRDARMQQLIKAEPITPFVSKVRALYKQHGVSSIIVIGGCGDYLSVADAVIGMSSYQPHDLTDAAKDVVKKYPAAVQVQDSYGDIPTRRIDVPRNAIQAAPPVARSMNFIELKDKAKDPVANPAEGKTGIDLSGIEQLVEHGQTNFISETLLYLSTQSQAMTMTDLMDGVEKKTSEEGLDATHGQSWVRGDTVRVRRFELGAAINRLRSLQVG